MRPLSAQQIIRAWEVGQSQHPLDRALTLLALGCPEQSPAALASLTIGQRDAYLLVLRELTFGSHLTGLAVCPHCGERVEANHSVSDFRLVDLQPPQVQEYTCQIGGFDLQFRLPNSWDLAAIVGQRDVNRARSLLGQRCLVQAHRAEQPVTYPQLPSEVVNQLTACMAECDPQAEIVLNFSCTACDYAWKVLFDIVTFFWAELNAQAKRLLREVHTLARFYGWREADILAMSTSRRQLYLSMVNV